MAFTTDRLNKALSRTIGYNAENKKEFGLAAKQFLREWAKKHNLKGDLYWSKGGIAVSGEVIFQTDTFEIFISESCGHLPSIMFRSRFRTGFKPNQWGSGSNNFVTPDKFLNLSLDDFYRMCRPSGPAAIVNNTDAGNVFTFSTLLY